MYNDQILGLKLFGPPTSKDFTGNHPDDIEFDEDSFSAIDTLSELSAPQSSSSSVVPSCGRDKQLKLLAEQMADALKHRQALSCPKESYSGSKVSDLVQQLKDAMKNGTSVSPPKSFDTKPKAEKPEQKKESKALPLHVAWYSLCQIFSIHCAMYWTLKHLFERFQETPFFDFALWAAVARRFI